jgi:hypothetical protein
MRTVETWLSIIFLFVVVAVVIVAVAVARNASLVASWRHAANSLHGNVITGGIWTRPTLYLVRRDTTVTVRLVRSLGIFGTASTQVVIHESPNPVYVCSPGIPINGESRPVLSTTCEIVPAQFWSRVAYIFGTRKPLTETPQFDLNYEVITEDPRAARQLLTRYVQMQIDRLRYFQGGNDVQVRFRQGSLTITRRGVMRTDRVLRLWIEQSLELHELAVASFAPGIDFGDDVMQATVGAVCKVCGDSLDGGEVVYCRVCDTPHHRDCWRYFGGCSVYACGEHKYKWSPRLARPNV